MNARTLVSVAAALWLALPPFATAQNATQLPTNEGNMSENLTIPERLPHQTGTDVKFAGEAASSARRQMTDADTALRESKRTDVERIAAMLRDDGERISRSLARISSGPVFIAAPSEAAVHATSAIYSDRTFIAGQLEVQRSEIYLFQRERQLGGDGALKHFAVATLPALQRNLLALQALPVD